MHTMPYDGLLPCSKPEQARTHARTMHTAHRPVFLNTGRPPIWRLVRAWSAGSIFIPVADRVSSADRVAGGAAGAPPVPALIISNHGSRRAERRKWPEMRFSSLSRASAARPR